jgi:hypothetical protein
MAQAEEKIFADGFSFKRREGAPDFVVGRISVKVDDAISFLKSHQKNGWVNLNCNQSRSGNYYLELDTFVPKPKGNGVEVAPNQAPVQESDLPF